MSKIEEAINASRIPVVVNFSATWCGPCRMFAPIFTQVKSSLEKNGIATLLRCDIDECEQFANEHKIQSVPTTIIFLDGQEVKRKSGSFPTAVSFERWVEES